MKFRVVSDLHIDINQEYPFEYYDDVFTVICGDICGDHKGTEYFIKKNIRNGVFVEGNHIGYSDPDGIGKIHSDLELAFPESDSVTYLNNTCKQVEDVLFVGATLWTDFKLNTNGVDFKIQTNMNLASEMMNDYRYNKILLKNSVIAERYGRFGLREGYDPEDYTKVRLSPLDTKSMHEESLAFIAEVAELNRDKKIVVVTHHAPSLKSISGKYVDHILNASYVSDLEDFIVSNPNIKVWCHGHIHSSSDYMIGNCRVVCNPRGYEEYEPNLDFDRMKIIEV